MSQAQQFNVSTATLTKGSDNVAVARQDLDGAVKNLRSAISNLLTMWRSAGSAAFGELAETWSVEQDKLQKVLGDVSTAMRENANDYALNEQQTTDAARRILANLV